MKVLGIDSHCGLLKEIRNKKSTNVRVTLNENPMYFDQEGNRNIEEPSYQVAIKVKDNADVEPPILLYDYFESRTREDARQFISQLSRKIELLGFKNIKVA